MPKTPASDKNDYRPDAWSRFEHAVDAAIKSGPMHKPAKKKAKKRRKSSSSDAKP